ncbi:MAG: bifunctional phosphoglucose/phosphomannose isomerase [Patescibacteria group bacterium]|jgi:glucose/mannose-6-phosphate isomerase
MGNLEQLDKIDFKKADPKGMINNIVSFVDDARQAFETASSFNVPAYYIKAKKIVLVGMGGSGAAGDIIKEYLSPHADLIVESIHDYSLPSWAGSDTLVILNSYSGNTEEVLAVFLEAQNRGAKMISVTTGGKLKVLSDKYKVPTLSFEYEGCPRASFPYLFILMLSVFMKLGYVNFTEADVKSALDSLDELKKKYLPDVSLFSNPAKILAEKIHGRVPVIFSSRLLAGAALRFKNQINENAKHWAFTCIFPELHHNVIEGMLRPENLCMVMMLESNFDYDRVTLRENISSEIMRKHKITLERIKFVKAKDQLSETLSFVLLGDFVSYYLAILDKVNPGVNEVIDEVKSKLS